jgi:hypothetical protein
VYRRWARLRMPFTRAVTPAISSFISCAREVGGSASRRPHHGTERRARRPRHGTERGARVGGGADLQARSVDWDVGERLRHLRHVRQRHHLAVFLRHRNPPRAVSHVPQCGALLLLLL